jgi:hypothetical protein
MLFAPESVGGARDLGQTVGGLRFCRLTTQFLPVNPLLGGHGAFLMTKKCAVRNPRSLVFTHWILYRSRRACHGKGTKTNAKPMRLKMPNAPKR